MQIKAYLIGLSLLVGLSTAHAVPNIETWQTHNGAQVYFVAAPELPMVDVRIVFDAGSARDGAQPATALMTSSLLLEGAKTQQGKVMDANEIAAIFDAVGAKVSASSAREMVVVSLRTLTENPLLTTALETFTQVLTAPVFPKDAFARQKNQLEIGLKAEKQSPGAIAARAFYSEVYGDHPYAQMPAGDESTFSRLSREDLKAFYQQYYVGNNAAVAIVGAVDRQQAKAIAEQVVGKLPQGKAPKALPPVPPITAAKTVTIAHPSSQTHLSLGHPVMARGDKDFFALYVGNHILGGSGLVSRLSDEVREKRGLTYGVSSYFNMMQQQGIYQFGLKTRNDQADEALAVVRQTLSDFMKTGPTAAELTAAKNNITGGFALKISSNSKIIGYLTMMGFYHLPLDYLTTFNDKIQAVTLAQIKDAYTQRVHPDKMITVRLGGKAE